MQRRVGWIGLMAAALLAGATAVPVCAQTTTNFSDIPRLSLLPPDSTDVEPQSVYAPPQATTEDEGINNGGVNTDVYIRYLTDDVYRGISHDRASGGNIHAPNYQGQSQLSFDLGKLPHPYVGVFANINDSDPVSRFQEIRPFFGVEYNARPLIFNIGHNSYIYPERERLNPSPNTSEVFLKITFDDSYIFLTPRPFFSPYIYAAYDYQRNKGWYIEGGIRHDLYLEEIGVTLTGYADVAYISNFPQQFVTFNAHDSGMQHYDIGVVSTVSLNDIFNFSSRYGRVGLQGYLTYTGRFSNQLEANNVLWGGVGVVFKY